MHKDATIEWHKIVSQNLKFTLTHDRKNPHPLFRDEDFAFFEVLLRVICPLYLRILPDSDLLIPLSSRVRHSND